MRQKTVIFSGSLSFYILPFQSPADVHGFSTEDATRRPETRYKDSYNCGGW